MAIKDLAEVWFGFIDQLFEFGHLANLFEGKDLILLISIDG